MTRRRGLTVAVLLCLVGSCAVLLSGGRSWALVEVAADPLVGGRRDPHTGTDLVPGLSALGLVGLAGVVALAATRRTGRTLVGLVLLVAGAGVVAAVAGAARTMAAEELPGQTGADTTHVTAWPLVAAAGGLVLLVAGLLTVAAGRSWPVLGGRYEAPGSTVAPSAPTERSLWEALDRGEDPTASLGSLPGPPTDREADRT